MKEVIRYTSNTGQYHYFFVLRWDGGKRVMAEVVSDILNGFPAHLCWMPVKQTGKVEILPAAYAKVPWVDGFVRRIANAEDPIAELEKIDRRRLLVSPDGKSLLDRQRES